LIIISTVFLDILHLSICSVKEDIFEALKSVKVESAVNV